MVILAAILFFVFLPEIIGAFFGFLSLIGAIIGGIFTGISHLFS